MSFSAIMDEMIPLKPQTEFEAPTRPVTPTNQTDGKTRSYLYHSESVAKALNQLSKDLSGVYDRNSITANTSRADGTQLLNDVDHRPAPSSAYQQFSYDLKVPGTMNDAPQSARPRQQVATSQIAGSSQSPLFVAPAPQPVQRHHELEQTQKPVMPLANFYPTQQEPMTVDPVMFGPNQNVASLGVALPTPDTTVPPVSLSPFTFILPPFSPSEATTSSSTPTPSLAIPSTKILSPTPSVPDLLLEDAETEDEAACQPTPQRASALKRSTRAPVVTPISRPKTRSGPAKPKTKPEPMLPIATTSSMPPLPQQPPTIYSVPVAPDAEANSDYQASDSGSQAAEPRQSAFAGGPARAGGKQTGGRRGSGGNHPYKQAKQTQSLGTGRQLCTYISPYDGWQCEQVLGRSYDVPRHMEVHAKEEYELVLTGKLLVQQSNLFDTVTEANVYVCLVCRKDFSRKDAMQRHIRNAAKMSKAKHRAEMRASLKKRVLGIPLNPPPNAVPFEILQRHRHILEKLKVEAQDLGQDVTDWDVENMIPQVGPNIGDVYGTPANAPGIPVGRRVNNKVKMEDLAMIDPNQSRSTRSSHRGTAITYDESEYDHEDRPRIPSPPATLRPVKVNNPSSEDPTLDAAEKKRSRSPQKLSIQKGATKGKAQTLKQVNNSEQPQVNPGHATQQKPAELYQDSESSSEYACEDEKNYGSVEEEDPMDVD